MKTRVSLGLVMLFALVMAAAACTSSPAGVPTPAPRVENAASASAVASTSGATRAPAVASTSVATPASAGATVSARGSADGEAETEGGSPHKTDIDDLFASLCKPDGPGAAVIVIEKGKVAFKAGYGLADLKADAAITPRSLFHLGSVGKQFTALGIMMLHEDGKLEYDDPIGKHLPELARFGDALTIRHLLHHTSGIADYDVDDALHSAIEERAKFPSNTDLLEVLAKSGKPVFKPGEKFKYSNTGYDVLGALIERLSGRSYAAFMQERVFGPVGMSNSFAMPSPRSKGPGMCVSYEMKGGRPTAVLTHPFDNVNGSGSVISNVEDLALYDQALFQGRLVKQATLEEAFVSGRLNDGTSTSYGFGWEVEKHDGKPTIGHGGSWLAFDNHYLHLPQQDLTVIVLMNQERSDPEAGKLATSVADVFLED